MADPRVLGGGDFVESLLEEQDRTAPVAELRTVEDVLAEVASEFGVPEEEILGLSRERAVSKARKVFYRRAYHETRETMAGLARLTGRTQPAVWQAVRKKDE